ncbi:hypothetical protein M7I_6178 [Glarea lozoyensis 74030]|uniref:Uncharacterized protein n=1 Tax=Glarea lozoyensis (strain ATCC 74030 / MF5533) TaxID=1104152 RepID=H0ETV7_GLAL7|nr:hypothetical protein M7I_6178 [Glarea lozoyensis 74030]
MAFLARLSGALVVLTVFQCLCGAVSAEGVVGYERRQMRERSVGAGSEGLKFKK